MVLIAAAILGGCASTPQGSGISSTGAAPIDRRAMAKHVFAGRVDEASKWVEQIDYPRLLLGMRVDNRYAGLVKSNPTRFDVERAMDAFIAAERAAVEAQPRSLRARCGYANALINANQYQTALDATTTAINEILSAKEGKAVFDDMSDYFSWLLDYRAQALWGLRRWDEAVQMLTVAAETKQQGQANVSQAINLALMSAKLGRLEPARDALARVGSSQSPYGKTQVALVKLIIAEQANDEAESDEALSYLKQNRSVSLNTYQLALVETNRLDEAEAFYISRLQNPETRFEALLEAQDYVEYYNLFSQGPERVRLRIERWQSVLRRDRVQREIASVGKIERSGLTSPM